MDYSICQSNYFIAGKWTEMISVSIRSIVLYNTVMDKEIAIRAYAKVNLSLGVGSIGPDGYHPVEMVLLSVDLYDTLRLCILDTGIYIETDAPGLPVDARNIAYRAAAAYLRAADIDQGVHIRIEKDIPIAAGLAGGSADAAAVLAGLNDLFGGPLWGDDLLRIAGELGSDVPFCLTGGLALATGRGTELAPLPPFAEGPVFVMVNPGVLVRTADVYAQFDSLPPDPWPDTPGLVGALGAADWRKAAFHMANMLEPAADSLCPVVPSIREALVREGALAARMSGSGPTVFGLFMDRQAARAAAERLGGTYPFVRAVSPVPVGISRCEGKTPPMQNY